MVPNKRSPVLYLITKNIDVKKFFWVLIADDVHKRSGGYFLKDRYPGSEFERIIKDEDCYAVFIYLQAYRKEDEIVDIYNYEEFLKSKCELLLFIDDNIYIDIYAKDIKLIEKIKKKRLFRELCKPPCRCKIKRAWRNIYAQKKRTGKQGKKRTDTAVDQGVQAAVYRGYPGDAQRHVCRCSAKEPGSGNGRGTGLFEVRLPQQGNGQYAQRVQREDIKNEHGGSRTEGTPRQERGF